MSIVRKRSIGKIGRAEFAGLKAGADEAIDYSDISELDADWFKKAKLERPEPKVRVNIRVDRDVAAFFRAQGRGYQTRMNAALRAFMTAHKPRTPPRRPDGAGKNARSGR